VQWQELYAACVSETDTGRLEKLVSDTEDAIFLRFQELAYQGLPNEVQELKRAAAGLLEFKIKKLGWPDPLIDPEQERNLAELMQQEKLLASAHIGRTNDTPKKT